MIDKDIFKNFVNAPLYYSVRLEYDINTLEFPNYQTQKTFYQFMGSNFEKVRLYCIYCQDDNPFVISSEDIELHNIYKNDADSFIRINKYIEIMRNEKIFKNPLGRYVFYKLKLECTNGIVDRYYVFIQITTGEGYIEFKKVGQFPDPNDIRRLESKDFIKILERIDSKEDFFAFLKHTRENMYTSAIFQLRRIFEKFLNYYGNKYDSEIAIKNDIKYKISLLKKNNELYRNFNDYESRIYDLLSISVHQLSNEQSMEMFEVLSYFVRQQIKYKADQLEQERLDMQTKEEIAKMHETFKTKKD